MRLLRLFAALLPGLCAGVARAETPPADLTAGNLTIHASASFGLVYADGAGHQAALPGFRVRVSQSTTGGTVVNTAWVQPAPTQEVITTEIEGEIEEGYYENHYTTGIVHSEWIAAVTEDQGWWTPDQVWVPNWVEVAPGYYDENDNWVDAQFEDQGSMQPATSEWVSNIVEITPGFWHHEYGDILSHQTWVSTGSHWGVIGTETEVVTTHHPAYLGAYFEQDTTHTSPRIEFAATRSDANWVWQAPSDNSAGAPMRDILIATANGLFIPSQDTTLSTGLLADGLALSRVIQSQSAPEAPPVTTTWGAHSRAHETRHQRTAAQEGGAPQSEHSVLAADALQLAHTAQAVTTTTQIAARSAHFGGVVTVEGSLKVKGVVRVLPAGNLAMAPEFQQGPTPQD